MTKVRLKYSIEEIDGTLYEVGLNLSHQEEKIIKKHPHKSSGTPSEAQKARRQHFRQAAAYATAALANPAVRAHYVEMAQQQGKRPRGAAIADYLRGNDLLAAK